MSNRLKEQSSPYLQQHAENPVDWYPWSDEAFIRAQNEDKPVFLSIGYSTCHWCHVMAHESFEDDEIAELLNRSFISVKVDKEERPDIDSVYMSVCQAFTGGGGWPTSIFMSPDRSPFFAGTYFPKTSKHGMIGFKELLTAISEEWATDREALLSSAKELMISLGREEARAEYDDSTLITSAIGAYKRAYDPQYGGFGGAPKFPAAHNLIFLMTYYQKTGDEDAVDMALTTLKSMYAGGLFDHIGYGFSRYSTDRKFLAPHFEKMLYDNALMILAYCKAYEISEDKFYIDVAQKTAEYVLNEMLSSEGMFFSAQDADSDGVEGGYYLFEPEEITLLLGAEDGRLFNEYYGISREGNFEGRSIPNQLHKESPEGGLTHLLPAVREYRKKRSELHTDDKIIHSWNALMIAALCALYRRTRNERYINAARRAQRGLEERLYTQGAPCVSYRNGRKSGSGFLDDYAYGSYALLAIYEATLEKEELDKASTLVKRAIEGFFDHESGGFYLYGSRHERLILRPKESYDGAMPSGNGLMTYVLGRLATLTEDEDFDETLDKQLDYMKGAYSGHPLGGAMLLTALIERDYPPLMITVVCANRDDIRALPFIKPSDSIIKVLDEPTDEYRLINASTTYYVCEGRTCLPPTNEMP